MCVGLCACVCVYVCGGRELLLAVSVSVSDYPPVMEVCISVYMRVCAFMCLYIYTYMYTYVYVYIHIHVCVCVCMYVYTYVYIHTHISI